ncbi:MAG: flagellar protein FlaG [Deferribacteraceae bacterium]|jgi:flagellar protein FlaG|nr:flagellar protein FlaG [Deferribacteraceae bacterium]
MSSQILNVPSGEQITANYAVHTGSGNTYNPPPSEKTSPVNVDTVETPSIASSAAKEATLMRARSRRFNVDEVLDRLVVKIIDSNTDEVIHQIPSEESLALSKKRIEINKLLFG